MRAGKCLGDQAFGHGPLPYCRRDAEPRCDLYAFGRHAAVADPVSFWAKIRQESAAFTRMLFQFRHAAWRQGFQVIVPPVEPTPKIRGESAFVHDGPNDIKTMRRFGGFSQPSEQRFGAFLEGIGADFTGGQGTFQSAQFVDEDTASDEDGDFGCAEKKRRVGLREELSRFDFRLQVSSAIRALLIFAKV